MDILFLSLFPFSENILDPNRIPSQLIIILQYIYILSVAWWNCCKSQFSCIMTNDADLRIRCWYQTWLRTEKHKRNKQNNQIIIHVNEETSSKRNKRNFIIITATGYSKNGFDIPLDLAIRHLAMTPCNSANGIVRNAVVPSSLPTGWSVFGADALYLDQSSHCAAIRPYLWASCPIYGARK